MANSPEWFVLLPCGRIVCRCYPVRGGVGGALGCMFLRRLNRGVGVLLVGTRRIHTWFVRFSLDAVYLDAVGTVVGVDRGLRPWRMGTRFPETRSVLEVNAGEAAEVFPGLVLSGGKLA